MQQPVVYQLDVEDFAFHVRTVVGLEGLSVCSRFELGFALDPQTMRGDPDSFDPDAVIKATAVLSLKRGEETIRVVRGVLTEVELSASRSGHPDVRVVLEPRLALLKHRRDVRIHRNLSVPEIVTEVAGALGVKVEARLRETYPRRPYCVEWRESDFDYVSRLLEDEGIFYAFTPADTLVLGDNPGAYVETGLELPFRDAAGTNEHDDAIHEFGERAEVTPGRVTLRDWNTEHPNLDMDVSHRTAVSFGPEWYDFPGEYEEPSEGSRKARLVAEALDRAAAASFGKSNAAALVPGSTFVLGFAPDGFEGGRFVVRRVEHAWERDRTAFEFAFEADRADLTVRPPRTTGVPRLMSPMTGIVCTNGEDIQCDHFGRVKVHFHWDRLRPYDDDCSHWIPVLQDNTGGSSAIPRRDWEVVVHFQEGDPDRPIVLGRVYNGDDVFREKLPHARDRSSLTSLTSPNRLTGNEIRFDDAAGAERIFMRAPKDMNVVVGNDQTQFVGNSSASIVGRDETIRIGGDSTWRVATRMEPGIGVNQSWTVLGNRTKKVGVGDANAVGGDHRLVVGGNHEQKVFSDVTLAAENLTEEVHGLLSEEYKQKHTTTVGGPMELTIGGALTEFAVTSKLDQTTRHRSEAIGRDHVVAAENEVQFRCDAERTLTVGGSLEAHVAEVLALTGAELHRQHAGSIEYVASGSLKLVVGEPGGANESSISLENGVFAIKTTGDVTIDIVGTGDHGAASSSQI